MNMTPQTYPLWLVDREDNSYDVARLIGWTEVDDSTRPVALDELNGYVWPVAFGHYSVYETREAAQLERERFLLRWSVIDVMHNDDRPWGSHEMMSRLEEKDSSLYGSVTQGLVREGLAEIIREDGTPYLQLTEKGRRARL